MLDLFAVDKIYDTGGEQVHALKAFTHSFADGSMTVVSGPSGSGKSTLLNLIGRVENPTGGRMLLDGKSIFDTGDKEASLYRFKKVGFIFQQFRLVPVLDVVDNIMLGLVAGGAPGNMRREYQELVDEMIEKVGLADRRKHRPSQLSGGQQQRVAIARALVKKPSIILADEPTASLDSKTAETIIELLEDLNRENNSICILATHDKRIIGKIEENIQLMDGEVVE